MGEGLLKKHSGYRLHRALLPVHLLVTALLNTGRSNVKHYNQIIIMYLQVVTTGYQDVLLHTWYFITHAGNLQPCCTKEGLVRTRRVETANTERSFSSFTLEKIK